jgi:filamin
MDDEFDKLLNDLEGFTKKTNLNAGASNDSTPVKNPEPPRPSISPQPKVVSPRAVVSTPTHTPSAGPTNQNLVVTGRGVLSGAAGEPTDFLVATKDSSALNASDLDVRIAGPTQVNATLAPNNDGSFSVKYTPTKPGRYTVDVSYKGEKAPKSPYRVYHQPRVTLNYELKGVVNGKIGETIRVTIEVKEEESKRAYVVDASAFDIVISGPETLKYILDDNNDGSFTLEYTPRLPGDYLVNIAVFGEYIFGDGFNSSITCPADASKSVVHLEAANPRANTTVSLKLTAVDSDGRLRTSGGDDFEAQVAGPEPKDSLLVDQSDGTWRIEFVPGQPGTYTVNVTLGGKHVSNSPLSLEVL